MEPFLNFHSFKSSLSYLLSHSNLFRALKYSPISLSLPIFAARPYSSNMAFSSSRLPFYSPSLPTPSSSSKGSSTSNRLGTIPTRILLLSDTHQTALFPPNDRTHAFKAPLPRADVVIHAGDLSNTGVPEQLAKTFNVLASIEAEFKLVIAGNHDLTLDAEYWRHGPLRGKERSEEQDAIVEEQIRSAKEMWTGKEARKKGIRYLEEGVHDFELTNGAKFRVSRSTLLFLVYSTRQPRSTHHHTRLSSITGRS
jgi:Calcineurin-like phosphoesterase